jgi:N12 class adenine-specific DNA methylase
MNQTLNMRAHQRHAVWRCMTAGNTLLAQTVGAGKTFIMAATGMKMRQAGLIRKPLYVVPNHMLEQFGREFLQLYPNAHLLVAAKEASP